MLAQASLHSSSSGWPVRVDAMPIRTAVAPERRHMLTAGEQWPDGAAAKQRLATDARRTQARAMKRIPEAQGLESTGGGARELDRHFDRIGAARW